MDLQLRIEVLDNDANLRARIGQAPTIPKRFAASDPPLFKLEPELNQESEQALRGLGACLGWMRHLFASSSVQCFSRPLIGLTCTGLPRASWKGPSVSGLLERGGMRPFPRRCAPAGCCPPGLGGSRFCLRWPERVRAP